jgi:DNA (cytosine-5)-methyltransferase 1
MRHFSTFSGVGGFELGIELAYERILDNRPARETKQKADTKQDGAYIEGEYTRKPPLCVGYSEIDKYAVQIYERHYPSHKNYGDITQINAEELPDFDCLVGGFPCQAFSIAGKRGGFEDTRGTMFFELARILRQKQPRFCVFENVKGLLSHDQGRTFHTIITTLDELGYDCQWQVLNSKNHGVPQNRERVFIIGHLRGTPRPEVFPFGEDGETSNELPRHYTNTLTARYEGAQAVGSYIGESEFDAQDLMIRDGRDNRSCLRSGRTPELGVKGMSIRRLTPTECERLQGFEDGWTEGVSDTQRYKTLGNAVTVSVIRDIFERLL